MASLRFCAYIHDQYDATTGGVFAQQETDEQLVQRRVIAVLMLEIKGHVHPLQQAAGFARQAVDEADVDFLFQRLEQLSHHQGLARTHFTGKQAEAGTAHHSIAQHGQCELVLLREIQEGRIRRQCKGQPAQLVEALVHGISTSSARFARTVEYRADDGQVAQQFHALQQLLALGATLAHHHQARLHGLREGQRIVGLQYRRQVEEDDAIGVACTQFRYQARGALAGEQLGGMLHRRSRRQQREALIACHPQDGVLHGTIGLQAILDAQDGFDAEALMDAGIAQIHVHQQRGAAVFGGDGDGEVDGRQRLAGCRRRTEHRQGVGAKLIEATQHLGTQQFVRRAMLAAGTRRQDVFALQRIHVELHHRRAEGGGLRAVVDRHRFPGPGEIRIARLALLHREFERPRDTFHAHSTTQPAQRDGPQHVERPVRKWMATITIRKEASEP